MAEKANTETTEPGATPAKNPMAEMCERFMAQMAANCGPKGFTPGACCSGSETASSETKCGGQTAEGKVSS